VLIKINAKGVVKEDDDDSHNNDTIMKWVARRRTKTMGESLLICMQKKDKTQICSSLIVKQFYCVVVEVLVFTFFLLLKVLHTISQNDLNILVMITIIIEVHIQIKESHEM
jgi:hypothetical protein